MIFTKLPVHVCLDLTLFIQRKRKSPVQVLNVLLRTAVWEIDGKVESAAVKCAAWNQAMNKMLAVFFL